jgi:hypothetical protein
MSDVLSILVVAFEVFQIPVTRTRANSFSKLANKYDERTKEGDRHHILSITSAVRRPVSPSSILRLLEDLARDQGTTACSTPNHPIHPIHQPGEGEEKVIEVHRIRRQGPSTRLDSRRTERHRRRVTRGEEFRAMRVTKSMVAEG